MARQKYFFITFTILILSGLFSFTAQCAYYETLPQNVRAIGFKQVNTGKINKSYGSDKSRQDFHLQQDLSSEVLENINFATETYFEELKSISPEAYEAFNLGEYEGSGEGRVNVKGFGMAYGITDRLMIQGSIAHYKGQVNFNINRTSPHNINEVVEILSESENKDAEFIKQLTSQLPDANQSLLQSVVVNYYEYEPLGNWQGQGFGDLDLALTYRLTDWDRSGLAIKTGVTLPTGKVENPNVLQDIGFGDGQTDIWIEFGGGVSLFNSKLDIDSSLRYTYQMSSEKELRVPESYDFPLSSETGTFQEKLGNIWQSKVKASYWLNDWAQTHIALLHQQKGQDSYSSKFEKANTILAANTETVVQSIRVGLNLTTTKLFLSNRFSVPLSIDLSTERMISGKNIPHYDRVDLELRIYF